MNVYLLCPCCKAHMKTSKIKNQFIKQKTKAVNNNSLTCVNVFFMTFHLHIHLWGRNLFKFCIREACNKKCSTWNYEVKPIKINSCFRPMNDILATFGSIYSINVHFIVVNPFCFHFSCLFNHVGINLSHLHSKF